ncbi:MAG: monovalent cation/H+ antiporter complex subunit F [Desulfobacterales bacterium]|nr:monovalent cation/H+ antiporter complex subunit F [Desulfobacterales bacterium]
MAFVDTLYTYVLYGALMIHILLMAVVALRLWQGHHVVDRLMASDMLGNLAVVVLVIGAMIHHQKIFLDVALGLAALGFITVIAFARYITNKRIF